MLLYVKPLPDEKHPSGVDVLRAIDVTDRAASSTEAAMNVREDVDFMIDRGSGWPWPRGR